MRRELISKALKERFRELTEERLNGLESAPAGPADFFNSVREKLVASSPADAKNLIASPHWLGSWTTASAGCRRSLMALSIGAALDVHVSEPPPVEPFMKLLHEARAGAGERLHLLSERYSSPLSFVLQEETEVREYLLARLMSFDRAQVEKGRDGRFDTEDLLLKLNLVAVMAARTADLRFLDALNYYYELLPAWTQSPGHDDTLLASYLALYAQALAAQM